MRTNHRAGIGRVEVLVLLVIVVILVALILPAMQAARAPARRSICRNKLKVIGLAIANYHDTHRTYPPGLIVPNDPAANPPGGASYWHWGTRILPFTELTILYDQLTVRDIQVRHIPDSAMIDFSVFRCPSGYQGRDYTAYPVTEPGTVQPRSSYAGVHHAGEFRLELGTGSGFFVLNDARREADIRDGLSNVLMVGEKSSSSKMSGWIWRTERAELDGASAYCARWPDATGNSLSAAFGTNAPLNQPHGTVAERSRGFYSPHSGGVHFAFGDGTVRFLNNEIDPAVFDRFISIADGEDVELP